MDSGVFVGIDHGGTTTTALVFDPERGKRSAHSVPMPKTTPRIDWVEHDPEDFLNTSIVAAAGALADAGSVSLEPDMTALGAACLAAMGAGYMSADEAGAMTRDAVIREPSMGSDEREFLWAEWRKIVDDVCRRARR